jgi:Cd2+/Zn2+-exporting ATPase
MGDGENEADRKAEHLHLRRVAAGLGLDDVHAGLMPEDKVTRADALARSNGPIAVIGDGVNDAPVLARADVGIAMASIGSDAALEAAPIVLMSNSLERLAWLNDHARKTLRIVRQNIAFALAVIVVMATLAVAGMTELPLAVIAHEGSTLLVALNALRLLRA